MVIINIAILFDLVKVVNLQVILSFNWSYHLSNGRKVIDTKFKFYEVWGKKDTKCSGKSCDVY